MYGPDGRDSLNDHNALLSPGSQLDLVLSEVRRLEEMCEPKICSKIVK